MPDETEKEETPPQVPPQVRCYFCPSIPKKYLSVFGIWLCEECWQDFGRVEWLEVSHEQKQSAA